ncbi:MAG TPA: NUDIX domain-containing protein [Chloroflexus aurantiacus]|uniref:NUDIX hydrolase n=2 Tax=Chloroflexaceae TaxID=1106 RepID=A9WE36_CHLAA|nr:NUDIX hydrolase [Chloroflexus aurantiacus J-10-fl]RMG51021.1 MAG: NUDIX domain-containing protein [Chloroflexota bacterium]HBW68142.1 NUDIX domain-containing protein [Chloroflexus aurantiacus]
MYHERAYLMREWLLSTTYQFLINMRFVAWRVLRPRAIGVRVIVQQGDSFLLVRHRGGAAPWGLPGGAIDRGETPADAARREALEESGCPVTITALHGVFHYLADGLSDYIIVFTAAAEGPPVPPTGDLEICDARFFHPDQLPAGVEAGSARRIAEARRGERGIFASW